MKKLTIIAMVLILSVITAIPAVAAPPLHRVTGGGTMFFPGYGNETYGITAIQVEGSGNAKGNVQFNFHYWDWVMHADVLYLAVNPDTGDAWIGGVITKSNYPSSVGREFYIQVRDNGEGSKASGPDMISLTFIGGDIADKALGMPDDLDLYELTNGNIQVK